jgi:hypothetical protein
MRNKIFLFALLVILLSSIVVAVDKDPCKKIRDNEQAKAMANKDFVEKVPNKNLYRTKFVGAVYDVRKTEFTPEDILKVFDAFVPLVSGEMAVYGNTKKGSSYSCEQIGILYGEVSYTGVSSVPFRIKNGNFRKAFKRGNTYNEFTLYDKAGKGLDFAMAKNLNGMYEMQAGAEIITYSANRKPTGDAFLHNHKTLPTGSLSNQEYYRIGASSTNDKCSIYWYMEYNDDSFAVKGNCSIFVESSESLKLGKEKFVKESGSPEEYTFTDSMIKTGKSWVSFSIDPHSTIDGYALQFYGRKKFQFDDITLFKNAVSPRIIVSTFEGFKNNKIFSKKLVLAQLPPLDTKIIYTFMTNNGNKNYGRVFLEDSNGNIDISLSQGNLAVLPSSVPENKYDSLTEDYGLYDRSKNLLVTDSVKNQHFRLTKYVKGNEDLKIIYPSLKKRYTAQQDISFYSSYLNPNFRNYKVVTLYHKISKKAIVFFQGEKIDLFKLNFKRTPYKWGKDVIDTLEFTTYIYDSVAEKVRELKCSSVTGFCSLDGETIYKPREYVDCRVSSQCSGAKVCVNSLCVNQKLDCKTYLKGGNLDLHVFGMDMTEKQIKTFLDKATATMFSLDPLKANKNKFTIKYQSIGTFSDFDANNLYYKNDNTKRNSRLDAQTCMGSSPDIKILLVPRSFRSFASGNRIYLSLTSIKVGVPDYLLVHEFGHAFGKLVDEYIEEDDHDCDTGINCNTPGSVSIKWPSLGFPSLSSSAQTNNWYGCGACDIKYSKGYIRPSQNSIMNNHQIKGVTFNTISQKVLEKRFTAY